MLILKLVETLYSKSLESKTCLLLEGELVQEQPIHIIVSINITTK